MQISTNGDGSFKSTLHQLSERIFGDKVTTEQYVLTTGLVRFLTAHKIAKKTDESVPPASGKGRWADVYEFPGSFEIKF